MAEKNPNKLYDGMKSLQDSLENIKSIVADINDNAKALIQDSAEFGGIVAKVFKEQMAQYFIPSVQKIAEPVDNLINGDRVPGSLKDLTLFLDSVPLAMVRQEPTVSELAAPVAPENVDLATPAESRVDNPVDDVPMNASYANGTNSEAPVQESKNRPYYTNFREGTKKNSISDSGDPNCVSQHPYLVIRKSTIGSSLGEDIANLEPVVVYGFDNKEDAEERAKELNDTITPEEKELIGTEYSVEERTIGVPETEHYEDDKDLKKEPKKI